MVLQQQLALCGIHERCIHRGHQARLAITAAAAAAAITAAAVVVLDNLGQEHLQGGVATKRY
jgi:FAD synthase